MLSATRKGTFILQILDQQNNSWQGTVTMIANNEKKTFRSLLELILLVNDALQSDEPEEPETSEEVEEE